MISYVYTHDYRDEEHPRPSRDQHQDISGREVDQPALLSSVLVYAIADKYDIQPLKELAKNRFETSAEKNWAHKDFSDTVKEIFESTPKSDRGLRDIAIRIIASHADMLIQKDEFRQLIEEVGDLGLNTLCLLLEKHSKEKADLQQLYDNTFQMISEWHGPCGYCGRRLFNANVESTSTRISVQCKSCHATVLKSHMGWEYM
jgi:hypothetical protein